jgi:hypothetical protein
MKQAFLNKYQEYCRARDRKEELFKMSQREDESLENSMEILEYNVQRSGHPDLDPDILKTIMLRGIRDEHLDILNLLGKGDISKESYQDILTLCRGSSWGTSRTQTQPNDTFSKVQKLANGGVTWAEIGNLLDNFKTDILSTLTLQIHILQVKQKHNEIEKAMSIFFTKCRHKHPLKECPLNTIEACAICEHAHPTKMCPSLPGLEDV